MTEYQTYSVVPSSYPHPLYAVEFRSDSYGNGMEHREPRGTTISPTDGAEVVASQVVGASEHTVMLDLDVPAALVPSSTEGHSHLYIDVPMSWRKYRRLLKALASAGVIEHGYYRASVNRKHTALRLPWVKK